MKLSSKNPKPPSKSRQPTKPIYLTNIPDPQRTHYTLPNQALTLKEPDCYQFWEASRKQQYDQLSWLQYYKGSQPWNSTTLNNKQQKQWFTSLCINSHPMQGDGMVQSKFTIVAPPGRLFFLLFHG